MYENDLDAHGYLQLVYRGQIIAEHTRMKAAIAALPFEKPKLSVSVTNVAAGFGGRMERLMEARGIATVIDATPFRKGEASAPEVFEPSGS
jgi:hypothetical protein